jgi:hypothetical protein
MCECVTSAMIFFPLEIWQSLLDQTLTFSHWNLL